MSRPRIIEGVDDRGRPKVRWADAPADAPRYGHMEPALTGAIERRKATKAELAAVRAREEAASRHVLSLGSGRRPPPEERRMIDIKALDAASARLQETARDATRAREVATTAWLSAAVAEGKARVTAGAFETALEALARAVGAEVPLVSVPQAVAAPALAVAPTRTAREPSRAKRTAQRVTPTGERTLTERQREILDAVVAAQGDRRAAAGTLSSPVATVEATLEGIGKKGLLPATLIPLLPARFAKYSTVQG